MGIAEVEVQGRTCRVQAIELPHGLAHLPDAKGARAQPQVVRPANAASNVRQRPHPSAFRQPTLGGSRGVAVGQLQQILQLRALYRLVGDQLAGHSSQPVAVLRYDPASGLSGGGQ